MDSNTSHSQSYSLILKKTYRLLVSALGAGIGLGAVLWFVDPPSAPIFLASFGGSASFLFGIPITPAAQPRAYFGGHIIGIASGVICFYLFGNFLWVYVMSFVMAFVFMLVTKTVHPPAGANPLIVLHANAPFSVIWPPIMMGLLILFSIAVIWSRLIPKRIHYPGNWTEKSPPTIAWSGWLE